MKEKFITVLTLFVAIIFTVSIYSLTIQSIGVDDSNKATIISGVLSMIGGMIGALVAGVIAIYISKTQLARQAKFDDSRERQLIAIKLYIEKYQEIYIKLTDLGRGYSKWVSTVSNYYNEYIPKEQLLREDEELQEKIVELRRSLNAYKPFLKDLEGILDFIITYEYKIGNLVYDYFTFPKGFKKEIELKETISTIKGFNGELLRVISSESDKVNL
ncbi:MAG: hypothetical protein WAM41_01095, partial [Psychrobacillus psychrotolerans]|uniref:hypothetical protein n=1 Tax=Psychrobacillus psychrotolerans TaxID=126156 RepID=UPI003BB18DBD